MIWQNKTFNLKDKLRSKFLQDIMLLISISSFVLEVTSGVDMREKAV
jgi:hypothetical protein